MKKERLFISIISIMLISSLQITAKTNERFEKRDLPKFSSIKLAISANVYITQSDKQSLRIEASDKTLKLIETGVKNGRLIIKWTKRNIFIKEKIKIYISMQDVKGIALSGSGNIIAEGKIVTDKLQLAVSGSGDIKFSNLEANDVQSSISGSANISLINSSPANMLSISISGSGNIDAYNFEVKNAKINVSGSGNCNINVSERLEAHISGSGDVYYKGNPVINGKVAGSGSIKSKN